MENNLRSRSAKGIFWSAVDYFFKQGIQLVISFIIARMLHPSDYGLIAMVWIFIDIGNKLVDSGFSNALIQKQDRTQIDYSTVFYFNIFISIIIYLIIYISAPAIASFYKCQELDLILKILSLVIVVNSFAAVQKTILTINFDFKRLAKISVAAGLLSGGAALYLAYSDCGVWTLVTQQIVMSIITTALFWYTSTWHPILRFSLSSFNSLFGFGSKLLAGALIHSLYTNLYSLIIGKTFSASQLGFYNRANSIAQLPADNITTVFERVTYPIECELQDDNQRLSAAFCKFIRMASYILFPVMFCIISVAAPLVKLVLTDKWLPCVPFLQLICIAHMFLPIMRMNWNLLNAKHRSDFSLKAEIIKKAVAFLILFVSYRFGVLYICLGMIAYSLSDWYIVTRYTKRVVPSVTLSKQVLDIAPILIISIFSSVMSYGAQLLSLDSGSRLFVGVLVFATSFLILSKVTRRKEYQEIVQLIKRK